MAPAADFFKIYIDQLRLGKTVAFDEDVSSEFLEIAEGDELTCSGPVHIEGEAYVANSELVLHLQLKTKMQMPCAICNEGVSVEIVVKDFYHVEPLSEIKRGIFDFQPLVREALLLEVPHFVECHEGACPQRKELEKYFRKPASGGEETYRPFADLE